MHRSVSCWHLGMPHTICGALNEVALLAHVQDLHWKALGAMVGCPASRLLDAAGNEVYASVYFVDLDGGERGLAAFGPDDEIEVRGSLGRYGSTMLDGVHVLHAAGTSLAADPSPALSVRLSFVLVSSGTGPDALQIATPANAPIQSIPSLTSEPDSYRLVKQARAAATLGTAQPGGRRLWEAPFTREYAINPDRDLNGVGLLYFANYVAFLDAAERDALTERAGFTGEQLYRRITLRRRIAYYGNAVPSDRLAIRVDSYASTADPCRLLVLHQVRRVSDGRLIALARADRQVRAVPSQAID